MSKLHGYCIGATRRLVATPPPGRFYPPPFLSPWKTQQRTCMEVWRARYRYIFFFIWSSSEQQTCILPSSLIFCIAPRPAIWRICCKFLFFFCFCFFFSSWETLQNWLKCFSFTTFLWLERTQPATCQMWLTIALFVRLAHKSSFFFFFVFFQINHNINVFKPKNSNILNKDRKKTTHHSYCRRTGIKSDSAWADKLVSRLLKCSDCWSGWRRMQEVYK